MHTPYIRSYFLHIHDKVCTARSHISTKIKLRYDDNNNNKLLSTCRWGVKVGGSSMRQTSNLSLLPALLYFYFIIIVSYNNHVLSFVSFKHTLLYVYVFVHRFSCILRESRSACTHTHSHAYRYHSRRVMSYRYVYRFFFFLYV